LVNSSSEVAYEKRKHSGLPKASPVTVATFATSTIDGLDGLSGGIMAIIYSMFGFIALYQDKLDISAFSFVIVGAVLAFL